MVEKKKLKWLTVLKVKLQPVRIIYENNYERFDPILLVFDKSNSWRTVTSVSTFYQLPVTKNPSYFHHISSER